jgi:hypothetical protein
MRAQDIIALLQLEPLPLEGGFFRQTYRAAKWLPSGSPGTPLGTAIYFLLTPDNFSAMHRLQADEIYHFYFGDPVEMLLLPPAGSGQTFLLGNDLPAGMRPQKIVSRGVWQGSRLRPGGPHGFALIGTTMTPGFTWQNFELGRAEDLLADYPDFAEMIKARVRAVAP